jgi:hypothetical protein
MSSLENHAHLDSSTLTVEDGTGSTTSSDGEPDDDDFADDDNNSSQAETSVDGTDGDPESQQDPQPPSLKQLAKKSGKGAGKVNRNRGVSGALDKAMSELIQLQDRIDEREEKRLRMAEEREDKRMQDDREAEERRRRWEQEQEDRRAREHREFMMQMILVLRQPPTYPPNCPNINWNGSGPSYTSL